MMLIKRSAMHILAVACCATSLLFSLPYTSKAVNDVPNPDWINSHIVAGNLSEEAWSDADQSMYNNVPCETATAYSWGWQSNGWTSWKVKTPQTACVTPGSSVYVGFRQILPLGGEYWQALDLSNYYHAWMLPNSGTNGLGIVTNSYPDYANTPSELYYTNDVLSLFNTFSKNSAGDVVRSPSRAFEHKLTYPDGRVFPFNNIDSVSYSANGRWMYLNGQDAAQLRVDTRDFSVFSFALGFVSQYGSYSSTTNSGNTIATYSHGIGLKLYDLTRCESEKPEYGSRNCASRDITETVNDELRKISADTPIYILGIKFQSESKLRLLLQYRRGVEVKEGFVDLEIAVGEQAMRYLALGDSFSSGEGVGNYYAATAFYSDAGNHNECHQSKLAYSEILNIWLTPGWYDSAACSGAVVKDVHYIGEKGDQGYIQDSPQARDPVEDKSFLEIVKTSVRPGYLPQLSLLQSNPSSVSTITIGGNDIGFGNIISACVLQTRCYTDRDDRERLADLIATQIPRLKSTYISILQNMIGSNPHLYVMGYPRIFNEYTICNNFMSIEERTFANNLVNYLNAAIQIATKEAGVQYIDVSDAFIDYQTSQDFRLCGNAQPAVNGLTVDFANMSDTQKLMQYVTASYHPNTIGHMLLAKRIRSYTNDFIRPMPAATGISSEPSATLYSALVGDSEDAINEYTELHPDIVRNTVINTGGELNIVFSLVRIGDVPADLSSVRVELHSNPVSLTSFTVSPDGLVSGVLSLPKDVEVGMHSIHIFYNDISGQARDAMQYIFVIGNKDDFDGDGVHNSDERCVLGGVLGIDLDHDGIDDACDPEILEKNIAGTVEHSQIKQAATAGIITVSESDELLRSIEQPTIVDRGTLGSRDSELNSTGGTQNHDDDTGVVRISTIHSWLTASTVVFVASAGLFVLAIKHKRIPK